MRRARRWLLCLVASTTACAQIAGIDEYELSAGAGGAATVGTASSSTTGGSAGVDYAALVVQDEPRAYWRLGESEGLIARDEMGQASNGQYGAGVGLGEPGALDGDTAAWFDGNDAIVRMGAVLGFQDFEPFSIELWVRLDVPPALEEAGLATFNGQYEGYALEVITNGDVVFRRQHGQTGPPDTVVSVQLPVGAYHHLVATFDGSHMQLYLDGNPVGSPILERYAIGQPPDSEFVLGASRHGNAQSLNGALDEVAVYDRALTTQEVQAHYDAARP